MQILVGFILNLYIVNLKRDILSFYILFVLVFAQFLMRMIPKILPPKICMCNFVQVNSSLLSLFSLPKYLSILKSMMDPGLIYRQISLQNMKTCLLDSCTIPLREFNFYMAVRKSNCRIFLIFAFISPFDQTEKCLLL